MNNPALEAAAMFADKFLADEVKIVEGVNRLYSEFLKRKKLWDEGTTTPDAELPLKKG